MLVFQFSSLVILAFCSAGYGDDLIVTEISKQLSMACNILLRNRPWVVDIVFMGRALMAAERLHKGWTIYSVQVLIHHVKFVKSVVGIE
jgi:hypothetical protein